MAGELNLLLGETGLTVTCSLILGNTITNPNIPCPEVIGAGGYYAGDQPLGLTNNLYSEVFSANGQAVGGGTLDLRSAPIGPGTGAFAVTVTVTDTSSVPLPNRNVSFYVGSVLVANGAQTDVNGQTTVNLNAGTYDYRVAAGNGYNSNQSLGVVISASVSLPAIELTQIVVTPSPPPLVTGYLTCLDRSGNPVARVPFTLVQKGPPHGTTGLAWDADPRVVFSDDAGLVEFVDMPASAPFTIQRSDGTAVAFTSGTITFQLPSCTN